MNVIYILHFSEQITFKVIVFKQKNKSNFS